MFLMLHTLLACTSSDPDEPTGPAIETADTAESLDTGWSPGDFGAFMFWRNMNNGSAGAAAVAVQTTPGFVNLPQCLTDPNRDTTCLPQLPKAEGTFIDFDPDARVNLELLRTRYLGPEVNFGALSIPFSQDEDTQAVFYRDPGTAQAGTFSGQQVGVAWENGFWPDYVSPDLLNISPPIEIISPAAGSFTRFTNDEQFIIEWVPTGESIITLEATSRFGFSRIFRLKDDGLFALDVDSLPWTSLVQDVEFSLKRWNRSEFRRFGHVVDVTAMSEVNFSGQFLNVGAREQLSPANTCQPAEGLLSLPEGGWWSTFDGLSNGVSICGAGGADAIYRVDMPPRSLMTVEYTAYGEDGVLGLSTTCPTTANACEDFSDVFNANTMPIGLNQPEFVEYFNISDRTESVYVLADTRGGGEPNFYTMDVVIDVLGAPTMFNTCGDVQPGNSLQPGVYFVQFTAYSNDLNPGGGGCTNAAAPGGESLVPITVPSGATLTVGIDMPDGDPSIYLLSNCNDAFQCEAGSDNSLANEETLSYTNSGPDQDLFLVIDTKTGQQPYFLSVNITP
ncbi:MAG: hypothetical protein AAGA48_06750 [Myxococcota bacterium]